MKNPGFDGKDRFMYNYHVFVKMKYPDSWQQRVMNAPVKYFEPVHANAWDSKNLLNAKVRSWSKLKKVTLVHKVLSVIIVKKEYV